ncbi:MAG: gliding motility-associated C-terminal domain-containing protein [Bacteroidia bacterium]
MKKYLVSFFCLFALLGQSSLAQLASLQTFGVLDGGGVLMNTVGWQLLSDGTNPAASVNDTGGDPDGFSNEAILTMAVPNRAGGLFYNSQLTPSAFCDYWETRFDFRIFDGVNGADGMAFVVASAIPNPVSNTGGTLGMPVFTGFSVCFDTYDNCGPANPSVQLRYNSTDECVGGPEATVPNLIQNAYHNCRVVYDNGAISIYLDGGVAPIVTGNYLITTPVFFGFTAANGNSPNTHSIKNALILVAAPNQSNAGTDATVCSGDPVQIGVAPQSASDPLAAPYTYLWSPAGNLSSSTASNPTFTQTNTTANDIVNTLTVTTSIGSCAANDDVTITVSPKPAPPTLTAAASQICSGESATLTANTTTTGTVNWYDGPAPGGVLIASGPIFNTPALSSTTTYYASVTAGGICESNRPSITITVKQAPNPPTVNAPVVCSGQDGIFQATAPGGVTFTWYNVAQGGAPVYSGPTVNVGTVLGDTTLYVSSTSTATGCTSTTLTSITLQVAIAPAPPNAVGDTVCYNTPANLYVNPVLPALTYRWYANSTTSNTLAVGSTFTTGNIILDTYYFVEARIANCPSNRTPVLVKMIPLPSNPVVRGDTICPNTSATLLAVGPSNSNFQWFSTSSSTTPLATGTSFTTPTLTSNTTFYVQTLKGACRSVGRTIAKAFVDNVPSAPNVADKTVCYGADAVLVGVTPPGVQTEWRDLNNNILEVGTQFKSTNVTSDETYIAYALSPLAGCRSFWVDTAHIYVSPQPTAGYVASVDSMPNAFTTMADPLLAEVGQTCYFLSTSTNAYTYTWKFNDPLNSFANSTVAGSNKPNFEFDSEGDYNVVLIIANGEGCIDSISKVIRVLNITDVMIPTAFTPNGDNINDVFTIGKSKNFPEIRTRIYSRWGNLVYQSDGEVEWDGKDQRTGEDVPEGVYTCSVTFRTNASKISKNRVMSVTLIR